MIAAAYRDPAPGLRARRDELLVRRRAELSTLADRAKRAYAWRLARQMSSIVALIGAILVTLLALMPPVGMLGPALLIVWIACAAAGALTWIGARISIGLALRAEFPRRGARDRDPGALEREVLRLEAETPLLVARHMADRHERYAVSLWLAALSWHAPVALLSAIVGIFRGFHSGEDLVRFDALLRAVLFAGFGGTLVLVVRGWRFGRLLRTRSVLEQLHAEWDDGWRSFILAAGVSLFWTPIAVIMPGLPRCASDPPPIDPSISVGLFTLVIWSFFAFLAVPGMYRHINRVVAAERQALGIEPDVNWPRPI